MAGTDGEQGQRQRAFADERWLTAVENLFGMARRAAVTAGN